MSVIKDFIKKVKGESVSIGIDIGHFSIKAVQVAHTSKGVRIINYAIENLPLGTIVDGHIQSTDNLSNTLYKLLQRFHPGPEECDMMVALSGASGVLTEVVKIATKPGVDEEEQILFDASNRSPFDDPDITLDYQIINRSEESTDLDVLLVAVRNDAITRWLNFFQDEGFTPQVVNADTFALYNSLTQLVQNDFVNEVDDEDIEEEEDEDLTDVIDAESEVAGTDLPEVGNEAKSKQDTKEKANRIEVDEETTVAIVNIGLTRSQITLINKGTYHSTRELPRSSINSFCKVAARSLGVKQEQFRHFIKGEKNDLDKEQAKDALVYAYEEFAMELKQAFTYFISTGGGELETVFLAGGGVFIPGFVDAIKESIEPSVELFDVCSFLPLADDRYFDSVDPQTSASLSVAAGMALTKG